MSSQKRYDTSYGTPSAAWTAEKQALREAEQAEARQGLRVKVTEDRFVRNILVGIGVVVCVYALAVFLGRVPVPDWLTR